MKKIFNKLLKYKHLLFLLFIIFLAVKPLFHPGFPPTHDGEYHLVRFYEFDRAIRDGDWYPRWAKDFNNGYGIPLFNYVYPFPNYVGSALHVFGISFLDAVKLNLVLATFVGVTFFYFWSRLFFDKTSAMISAIFYTFAPYRFVDIYIRGSVGEVWALGWFPAFLWSVTKLIKTGKVKYIIWSGIFFALTVFSHNILALIFACFGVTYVVFMLWLNRVNRKIIFFSLFSFFLGLCLSAIFWLPALIETKFTVGLQIFDTTRNFPELYQLLMPSWGTGFSTDNIVGNQMSFQIGVANLLVIVVGFILLIRSRYIFFISWFILLFFLMLQNSLFVWQFVPLLNYFQFPWRLLSLIILICAFMAGAVLNSIENRKKKIFFSIIFIISVVFLSFPYTQPAYYHDRTDTYYISRDNFMLGTNSPGNAFNTIWMNPKVKQKKQRVEIVEGKGKIIVQNSKTSKIEFKSKNETEVKILANVAYFPGWKLVVNGNEKPIQRTKDGIMSFSLPRGSNVISLQFDDTMVRSVGNIIFFSGIVVCIILFLKRKKIEKR